MHWLGRHRFWILAGICLFWTGLVVVAAFSADLPFLSTIWRGEQSFQDVLCREGRKTATHHEFVWLGIDQSTLEFQPFDDAQVANNRALQLMGERPFPWSREVWAIMLDRLFQAGARLVIFDLIFNPPNDGDPLFRQALDRHRAKVVLGANFDLSEREGKKTVINVPPNTALIPAPQMQDDRVGYVVFFPDPLDQKIRRVHYTLTESQLDGKEPYEGETPLLSLSARALEKLGHANDVPRDLKAYALRFSAIDAYLPRPLWEIFDEKIWQANYAGGAFFKGKIVMIGSSAQVVHDVFSTPMSPETPGPTVHLHALAAAMDRQFLTNTPLAVSFATIGGAGILAWILIAWIRRPITILVSLVVISAAYLGMARLAYDQLGLFLITVPTLTAFLTSGLFGLGFEYALERLEKLRTRRTLERYVSKNLVKEILDNPDSYYHSLRGVRVPATMLFSDIVGFTTLSERADPEALVAQLNEYLTRMTAVVFENGGTLDKFIGDAIMAVWGNVHSLGVAEDAKNAVRSAFGMRRELAKLNEGWRAENRMGLGIGVGVNQGEVIVGNVGSQERMDPTVIGDAVNLASRLEALTRSYGVDILIGASAAELVRDEFHLRSVARAQVKGKTKPVDIFTLVDRKTDIDPQLLKWLESYEEGITKFRERDFIQAKILFSRFLEFYPDDSLAKMYLERALEYEQEPPDEAWNAVEVFTKK